MTRRVPMDKLRILLVGAGALGCRVAEGLLESGFRRIVVDDEFTASDPDVDGHFFFEGDVGVRKRSSLLVDRLEKPDDARIVAISTPVPSMDSWNYDLYIGCSCMNRDRAIMNAHSREYRIPFIDGVVSGDSWRVQAVRPDGPCLGCFLKDASSARPQGSASVADRVAELMIAEMGSLLVPGSAAESGICFSGCDGGLVRLRAGPSAACRFHGRFEV